MITSNNWIDFHKQKPDDFQEIDVWVPGGGRIPNCVYGKGTIYQNGTGVFIGSEMYWMPVPKAPFYEKP